MSYHFQNDWESPIQKEFKKDYYLKLRSFLKEEYRNHQVFPPMTDIFNALNQTPLSQTKVCILGQDPYHGYGQSHGLAFSVKAPTPIPPSLANIYKELAADLGYPIPKHGCLDHWTSEGVLLLNAVLTVRAKEPGSHRQKGWETFTGQIIKELNDQDRTIVFILWGRDAQAKQSLITNPLHQLIISSHPSPLSAHRSFFGSRPFSKSNAFLKNSGQTPIDWAII